MLSHLNKKMCSLHEYHHHVCFIVSHPRSLSANSSEALKCLQKTSLQSMSWRPLWLKPGCLVTEQCGVCFLQFMQLGFESAMSGSEPENCWFSSHLEQGLNIICYLSGLCSSLWCPLDEKKKGTRLTHIGKTTSECGHGKHTTDTYTHLPNTLLRTSLQSLHEFVENSITVFQFCPLIHFRWISFSPGRLWPGIQKITGSRSNWTK